MQDDIGKNVKFKAANNMDQRGDRHIQSVAPNCISDEEETSGIGTEAAQKGPLYSWSYVPEVSSVSYPTVCTVT